MAPGVDPALLPCCVLEALGCGWPATSASKCQCTTSWHVTHIWDVWTCWGNGPKFVGEVPAASPVRQSDIGLLGACKSPRYRHVAMLPECLCRFWTPRVSTHADPATAFHACAARRVARFNHGTCRGRNCEFRMARHTCIHVRSAYMRKVHCRMQACADVTRMQRLAFLKG